MASEAKRGCGYRTVGGLYLCGKYITVPCDRLPYPIGACPVCGEGLHFTRGYKKIIPLKLFGLHRPCNDTHPYCFMCEPTEHLAFLMTVGEKHYPTPDDFMEEGRTMGISKKIPSIPKELEVGMTIVYLAHPKAIVVRESEVIQEVEHLLANNNGGQQRLFPEEKKTYKLGIFTAFIPNRVEMPVWESDFKNKEKMKDLEKRGITPVSIPNGDKDHAPKKKGG
jgi:hypothetical protein